ncbi:hypothetical protein FOA52_006981 [Chlamydomonas sp. UWO 241]|nr:hypothetical protein FOA52_006981 [Chlamydomonas sp. UWO 241]
MMAKAKALGLDTRNVSNGWLKPLGLRNSPGASPTPGSPCMEHGASGTATPTSPGAGLGLTHGTTGVHYNTTANFVQLSPHYGPGQNSPKALSNMRTTAKLQGLGRVAIYSSNPYIESALESLVPESEVVPPSPTAIMHAIATNRRLPHRLPRKGAKSAALHRARRRVARGTEFRTEVPFADAAVAQLLQHGYYLCAIKVVYNDFDLLRATLEEMKLLLEQNLEGEDWEVTAHTWLWAEADKELFVQQFAALRIISYYCEVRTQMRALRQSGAVALCRVECEMLAKVTADFMAQVDEDARAAAEAAAAAAAEEEVLRQSAAAVVEARRLAVAARKADADASLAADAAARAYADERRRAAAAAARAAAAVGAAARAAAKEEAAAANEDAAAAVAARNAADTTARQAAADADAEAAAEAEAAAAAAAVAAAAVAAAAVAEEAEEAEAVETAGAAGNETAAAATAAEAEVVGTAEAAGATETPNLDGPPGEPVNAVVAAAAAALVLAAEEQVAAEAEEQEAAAPGASGSSKPLSVAASKAASAAGSKAPSKVPSLAPSARQSNAGARQSPIGAEPSFAAGLGTSAPGSRRTSIGAAAAATEAAALAVGAAAAGVALSRQASFTGAGSHLSSAATTTAAAAIAAAAIAAASAARGSADGGGSGSAAQLAAVALAGVLAGVVDSVSRGGSRAASRPTSRQATSRLGTPSLPAGSPLVPSSRPRTAEQDAAVLASGIEEMRRQMSVTRHTVEDAATQLRASFSRPATATSRPGTGSRPGTTGGGAPQALDGVTPEGLSDAMAASAAGHASAQDAERAMLSELLGGSSDDDDGGGAAALDAELRAREVAMAALAAERVVLLSAQSQRAKTPLTPAGARATREEAARLKEVEIRMAAEAEAAKALEEQRAAVAAERAAMVAERAAMAVRSKEAMNAQITRTMRMFQEQLAQTVKMAAMLQAQRIMTGGMAGDMPTAAPMINLPQEVDEPPSPAEIAEYARYLGMDPVAHPQLLYVAEWALTAPVPEGWTVHLDADGNEFFHNNVTAQSMYEHPMDAHYKKFYDTALAAASSTRPL